MPESEKAFWNKIWRALRRVLGFILLLTGHCLLDFLFSVVFYEDPWVRYILHTSLIVATVTISFLLLIGMVSIFVPNRKQKRQRKANEKTKKSN